MAVLASGSAAVVAWAGLLKQLIAATAVYDDKIDALAREHPDYKLVRSFPGVGPVLAPRLIAALGSQRDRYQTAHQIQCYSGIAPVIASSGKQRWIHWRWSCPRFLRQTFLEWALDSIAYSTWAREYYEQQRAKGKGRNTIIRSLAFKWIRVLFRCWKNRTPYEETVHQRSVEARRPAPPTAVPAVELQWKKIASFCKIAAVKA